MRRRQSFVTVLIGKSVLIREGIARILRAANFRTLASVSYADDLPLGKFQSQHVLVLIFHTGDDIDSVVEQIEFSRERHPKARIAIVADHYRLDEMVATFRAGANGYFIDVMTCDVFVKSLELVMMGETIFPPAFMSYVLDSENDHLRKDLTGRCRRACPQDRGADSSAIVSAGEINPALSDRRRLQQIDSPEDRYRRGDREGPRQGDPSQDQGPEPDASGDLGTEQRLTVATGD